MQFEQLNIDALKRATDAVLGPKGTETLSALYFVINAAMTAAHQDGYRQGFQTAEVQIMDEAHEAVKQAYDMGQGVGYLGGYAEGCDDGYMAGVEEQKTMPEEAARTVEEIQADLMQDALDAQFEEEYFARRVNAQVEGFDEPQYTPLLSEYQPNLVQDSGDENAKAAQAY